MPELAVPLQSLIADGAEQLRRARVPEPRRQALRIWAEMNGTNPAEALLGGNLPIDGVLAARFQRAIERRSGGEPLSHVTGRVGFRHLSLWSDRRALIPRPETEGLVDLLLQRVRSGVAADVGTGSGCLALSLAVEGTFSQIVAIDCSADALTLARLNGELVIAESAVSFVQGDLCAPLRGATLDALVSNPPYLTAREYASLEGSVRDWEPELALVSGEDGLEATTRLLDEGRAVLRLGGWLALEVDSSRAALAANWARSLGWEDVTTHMDLFGRERYLLARRSDTR